MVLIYPLVAVVVLTQASLEEHTGCTICDVDVYCRSDGYCCNNTIDNLHDNVPRYMNSISFTRSRDVQYFVDIFFKFWSFGNIGFWRNVELC